MAAWTTVRWKLLPLASCLFLSILFLSFSHFFSSLSNFLPSPLLYSCLSLYLALQLTQPSSPLLASYTCCSNVIAASWNSERALLPLSLSLSLFLFSPPPFLLFTFSHRCNSNFFIVSRNTRDNVSTLTLPSSHIDLPLKSLPLSLTLYVCLTVSLCFSVHNGSMVSFDTLSSVFISMTLYPCEGCFKTPPLSLSLSSLMHSLITCECKCECTAYH